MATTLCSQWEQCRQIRKRFRADHLLLAFPKPRQQDEDKPMQKENPINTLSLSMNASAVKIMVDTLQVLSGKRVPIQKVEDSVICRNV